MTGNTFVQNTVVPQRCIKYSIDSAKTSSAHVMINRYHRGTRALTCSSLPFTRLAEHKVYLTSLAQ